MLETERHHFPMTSTWHRAFELHFSLPSGQRLHKYGKLPIYTGFSQKKHVIFKTDVSVYQRVYRFDEREYQNMSVYEGPQDSQLVPK